MCGIIGILGQKDVVPSLLKGLKRLEYRGYDSTGIATITGGKISRLRTQGKLLNLEKLYHAHPLMGTIGIGHTRWATHGAPNEENAHPHATDDVALVHNGIIENFQHLKKELQEYQYRFQTDTDTEVIAFLVTHYLKRNQSPLQATLKTLDRLKGAFALAIIFVVEPQMIIGVRQGTPLTIGYGDQEMYLSSDALAISCLTDRICDLEDRDLVVLHDNKAEIYNRHHRRVSRPIYHTVFSGAKVSKEGYQHFMAKEIYEQPRTISDTLDTFVLPFLQYVSFPELSVDFSSLYRVTILACGTAYYAGYVAKYWLERIARLPVDVEVASEFRYREVPLSPDGLTIVISQSGETFDTLEALRYAKRQGQTILSILNVAESSIAKESDIVLPTRAGPEIGVASTKAFTAQLMALACLTLQVARERQALQPHQEGRLVEALRKISTHVAQVLDQKSLYQDLAHMLSQTQDVLYLGRDVLFPIALEGALKLKEISYIHAQGYAAGELKHGPLALIDETVPLIVLASSVILPEKMISNIQEVKARGGRIVLIADEELCTNLGTEVYQRLFVPRVDAFVAPILYTIPVQLLAYYVGVCRGTDVDQPRNLAKSVTVE